jgi:hypothetical protein
VVRAEHGSEQQLLEACELLLLQRCFRELLLEEFATTLHLVGRARLSLLCALVCKAGASCSQPFFFIISRCTHTFPVAVFCFKHTVYASQPKCDS